MGLALAGCGSGVGAGTSGSHGVRVVAAENFWGNIAAQLGGTKASVQSIIVNPAQDPHSYEPTAADARTLAAPRQGSGLRNASLSLRRTAAPRSASGGPQRFGRAQARGLGGRVDPGQRPDHESRRGSGYQRIERDDHRLILW